MPEFKRPHALADVTTHYCPGCTHGIVHRLVAEVIDEMGIEGETIGVSSYLHIRVMATLQLSVRLRLFTPLQEAKISLLYLSTTRPTV